MDPKASVLPTTPQRPTVDLRGFEPKLLYGLLYTVLRKHHVNEMKTMSNLYKELTTVLFVVFKSTTLVPMVSYWTQQYQPLARFIYSSRITTWS